MAFYEIEANPDYIEEIRRLENTDPANAETIFNPLFSRVINNIEALKRASEASVTEIKEGLTRVASDLAMIAFKLTTKDFIDTAGMKQVIVDTVEAAEAVTIISGVFDNLNKKVYI